MQQPAATPKTMWSLALHATGHSVTQGLHGTLSEAITELELRADMWNITGRGVITNRHGTTVWEATFYLGRETNRACMDMPELPF